MNENFHSNVFAIAPDWELPKCPSTVEWIENIVVAWSQNGIPDSNENPRTIAPLSIDGPQKQY